MVPSIEAPQFNKSLHPFAKSNNPQNSFYHLQVSVLLTFLKTYSSDIDSRYLCVESCFAASFASNLTNNLTTNKKNNNINTKTKTKNGKNHYRMMELQSRASKESSVRMCPERTTQSDWFYCSPLLRNAEIVDAQSRALMLALSINLCLVLWPAASNLPDPCNCSQSPWPLVSASDAWDCLVFVPTRMWSSGVHLLRVSAYCTLPSMIVSEAWALFLLEFDANKLSWMVQWEPITDCTTFEWDWTTQ